MSATSRLWLRFGREDRGNVAMIFGLALVPLVGLIGLAVDYGDWSNRRTSLTKAADAGSLAGIRELINAIQERDDGRATARAQTVALNYLNANGIGASTYTVSPSTAEPVKVTIELSEAARRYFSQVIDPKTHNIDVVSEAIATKAADACVIALAPNASVGIDFNLSGDVVANDCSIWSNAQSGKSISGNGSGNVRSATTCAVGGASAGGGIHFKPDVKSGCLSVKDPLAKWSPPVYASSCTKRNLTLQKPGLYTLEPGVYCGGIDIRGGAIVTLKPGLYVIQDGPLSVVGGGAISGSEVSILFTGNKAVADLGGASVVNLSAPTSGPMAGLVLAAGRDEPQQTSTLAGNTNFRLEGHVYLPTHDLKYSGGPEGVLPAAYTNVIARTIKFDGTSRVEFRKNTSGGPSYAAKAFIGIHLVH